MKEKALKKDMIHTLETIAHYIKEAKYDYDMEDLRYLFDENFCHLVLREIGCPAHFCFSNLKLPYI